MVRDDDAKIQHGCDILRHAALNKSVSDLRARDERNNQFLATYGSPAAEQALLDYGRREEAAPAPVPEENTIEEDNKPEGAKKEPEECLQQEVSTQWLLAEEERKEERCRRLIGETDLWIFSSDEELEEEYEEEETKCEEGSGDPPEPKFNDRPDVDLP
jgi:hypothetical protein